ncbi:hypothetical protein AAFF_G00288900 [Aldrovandia affinis]|uniref:Uncharacterized protein n=1 Tax=Aldrovandia affinis TaxID=143900 RepID=A0AAD7SQT9_9TELE|nr:hypothetical protein AAFF_G00288900 [Aldrovandia affinis]
MPASLHPKPEAGVWNPLFMPVDGDHDVAEENEQGRSGPPERGTPLPLGDWPTDVPPHGCARVLSMDSSARR